MRSHTNNYGSVLVTDVKEARDTVSDVSEETESCRAFLIQKYPLVFYEDIKLDVSRESGSGDPSQLEPDASEPE